MEVLGISEDARSSAVRGRHGRCTGAASTCVCAVARSVLPAARAHTTDTLPKSGVRGTQKTTGV